MFRRSRLFFVSSFSFVIAGLITACVATPATAQEKNPFVPDKYRFPDEPEDLDLLESDEKRAYREAKNKIKANVDADEDNVENYLQGSGSLGSTNIKEFIEGYVFGNMMALEDSEDLELLNSLSKRRDDFIDDYVDAANPGPRAQLIDQITIPKMREIAEDAKFHPAVRHNAVMIIGRLDTRSGDRAADVLPTPSANAANYLKQLAGDDTKEDYLRVAALAGIQRHLLVRSKPDVYQTLIDIVKKSEDSKDLEYWLKRRAVQCLGLLKEAGPDAEVVSEMRKILKDETARTWLKFDAINTLAQLDFASVTPAQAAGMSYEIAEFAANDFVDTAEQLLETRDHLIWANAIYSDKDLEQEGTNEANKNAQGRGGDTLGFGGMGGGGDAGNDDQGSGGKDDGGGRPADQEDDTPKVELANYHLNSARRRAKIIANRVLTAHRENFASALQGKEKEFASSTLAPALTQLIEDTDVGIINLDEEEDDLGAGIDEPNQEMSNTEIMAKALQDASKVILADLPGAKKAEDAASGKAGEEADATAPAANQNQTGDSEQPPFGGN